LLNADPEALPNQQSAISNRQCESSTIPAMTIEQAVEMAVQHHRAGRVREAEALYRQVLGAQPGHADALHLLGVLAHQTGRTEYTIQLIPRAAAATRGAGFSVDRRVFVQMTVFA
jgi:hypothetical protein